MNEELSWSDANAACRAAGMELASVHSAEENDALLAAVAGKTVWIGGIVLSSGGIGAASKGKWVWMSYDSGDMSYTNWANGQPDNSGGCLAFNYQKYVTNSGQWDDQSCTGVAIAGASVQLQYVCQIPL